MLDRLGRRPSVALFAIGCVGVTIAYLLLPIGGTAMLLLGFPLGFCAAGIPASMGALFNELYPGGRARDRGGLLLQFRPHPRRRAAGTDRLHERRGSSLGTAIGLNAAVAYWLVLVALLLLPETRGKRLEGTERVQPVTAAAAARG